MAVSLKPEISKKWWTSEKPSDVKGQDLEKALAGAEKALAEAGRQGDAETIESCFAALKVLSAAAEKTIKKECDKKKHKEIISALEQYEDLIEEEIERLEERKSALENQSDADGDGESEDDEKGILKPEYLERMIKQLRSGNQVQFCFGLNKSSPADSRLLLCNKRKPERLHKVLKGTGDFSKRLMTFGYATGDGKTLQFRLSDDAKEPSQIAKLAKEFLKGNRELKYKKIRIVCGNETFEEDMDIEGGAAGELGQELAKIEGLVAQWKQTLNAVSKQIDELRKALEGQSDPVLRNVHEGLATVMEQFPDLDLTQLVAAAKANNRGAYDRILAQSAKEIGQVRDLLTNGPLLSTIDENPFVKTNIHQTVNSALQRIVTALSATA
jgi:hypothetical protein